MLEDDEEPDHEFQLRRTSSDADGCLNAVAALWDCARAHTVR